MTDFICEERPSSRRPAMARDVFVAEFRPRFRLGLPTFDSSISEETALKVHQFALEDQDTTLSLEKLLSNKSQQEYTGILTRSIIKLVQTLLFDHDVAAIEGSLQVSFHGIEQPIQVKLNEVFSLYKKDTLLDVEKHIGIKCQGQLSPSLEMNWDVDHYMYHNQLSPDLSHRDEISSVRSSPPRPEHLMTDHDKETAVTPGYLGGICSVTCNISPTYNPEIPVVASSDSDSGEDSGYTDNDRDESSDSHGDESPNMELQDQGNAPKDYVYAMKVCLEEASEHDDDIDRPLVIDVMKSNGGRESVQADEDTNEIQEASELDNQRPIHQNDLISSSSDDGDYNLALTCSDDTGFDVPMDLSGDCKIVADSKSLSKENGNEVESPSVLMSFKCQMCVNAFPDVNALCKHVLRQHQAYMCQHCSRLFTAKNNLKRHIRIHTGLKPYKCNQCSTTFARRDDLKGHLLRHDYNKPYRCSICRKGYTDRVCVKNHMVKEHGSRLMFVCPLCGESFDQEDSFSAHKKTHPELNQYACDICPFIGSNNLMACKHSLVHTRKLFSCKPCNAFFADPFGYTEHIRKHKKNENFINYVCCFCDIALPTYEQFIRHEYSHAHCKTHACQVCSKQFRSKLALQEHAMNHHESPDLAFNENHTHDESITEDGKMNTTALDEKDRKDTAEEDNSKQDEEDHVEMGIQKGALDLSLKKVVTSPTSNPSVTSAHSFTEGQVKISHVGVPRNGYAAEFSCPSVEESCLSRMEETLNRATVTGADDKHAAYNLNTALEAKIRHKKAWNLSIGYQEKCPSVALDRPFNQLNGQSRFRPYPLPLKAAELASKFFLARGRSPFIHASATKDIDKGVHSPFERKELVIEKDSTGKTSIHIVSQTNLQENLPTSVNEEMDEKENNHHLHVNDIEQSQTPNVFYGLTGKQYRKDCPISPSLPTEESSIVFTSVKQEPMDQDDFAVKPRPIEHVRESSLSPPTPTTVSKPPASHSCDICSQTFECFSQLESHSVLTHKRYMCEYCKKGFTSRPNRDRHVRYHTGERPYKCDLCDTAFHRGDDLKYHRTTRHPEATPFVCSRCSATFTWKRDLDRHVRHSKCKF